MKIEKGILISIEESDIKNGILKLPKRLKKIGDNFDSLSAKYIHAPSVTTVGNYSFSSNSAFTGGDFPALTTVGNDSFSYNDAFTGGDFPALTTVGNDSFSSNSAFTGGDFPALTTVGNDSFSYNDAFTGGDFPALTTVGNDSFSYNDAFTGGDFPALTTVGNYSFRSNSAFTGGDFPALTTVGNDSFSYNDAFTGGDFPALTTVGNDSFSYNDAFTGGDFPALTTVGNYSFRYNDAFTGGDFPALTTVGNDSFRSNSAFTGGDFPALTTVGNYSFRYNDALFSLKTKKHDLKIQTIDGMSFIEENKRSSKGIKIKIGFIFNGIVDNEIQKKYCFITEKDGFFAHGIELKKAISDLNFKIVSEKLRKEPIYNDTVMTDNYYRLITGACEMGVKNWRESNNITVDEITVEELLPLLEKSNAYGVEKFKSLISNK